MIGAGLIGLAALGAGVVADVAAKRMTAPQLVMDPVQRQAMQEILGDFESPARCVVEAGWFVRGLERGSDGHMHWGIDVCGARDTPIFACKSGLVVHVGPISGYGNCVQLSHLDANESTHYAHLEGFAEGLEVGQLVVAGTQIAQMGNSTHNAQGEEPAWVMAQRARGQSMGVHLHMEVWPEPVPQVRYPDRRRLDPVRWLRQQGIEMACEPRRCNTPAGERAALDPARVPFYV